MAKPKIKLSRGELRDFDVGQLKQRRRGLLKQLKAARKAGQDKRVANINQALRRTRSRISERRGLPAEIGRVFGRGVPRKPFKFKDIREEVEREITPFFEARTREEEELRFDRPVEDVRRTEVRGAEDIARGRVRLRRELDSAREFRDITEGQERRGQIRDFGARNIARSPAAERLRERLRRVQRARTEAQERGFTESGQDITRQEGRLGQDIARQRQRLARSRELFKGERKRQLQELVGEETANTAFRNIIQ